MEEQTFCRALIQDSSINSDKSLFTEMPDCADVTPYIDLRRAQIQSQ
jgi:hypothetical protein